MFIFFISLFSIAYGNTRKYPCVLSEDCAENYAFTSCTISTNLKSGVRCSHPTVSIDKSCGGVKDYHSGVCLYPWKEGTKPSRYYSIDEIHNTTYCSGELTCYGEDDRRVPIIVGIIAGLCICFMCCVLSCKKSRT